MNESDFARTLGATLVGTEARVVDIQVSVHQRSEGAQSESAARICIVGLPDSTMREGRERIRAALLQGGWSLRGRSATVNLAPAADRKQGAALDLPIALALLGALGALKRTDRLRQVLCLGELVLDGTLRPVRGALAGVEAARRNGVRVALVPRENAAEAASVEGVDVYAADALGDAVGIIEGTRAVEPSRAPPWSAIQSLPDSSPVRGQDLALRGAWVAACGRHNVLLVGPPGSGKTMLAREIRDLLPPLDRNDALEISRVYSAAGLLQDGLVRRRPFRSPHHSASLPGLVGGGTPPRPGEISLAHGGVLFLDELPEFARPTLEALRQPIEDGALTVSRAGGRVRLPSRVVLVAAMNPCPCGWHGVPGRCSCGVREIARYQARISGPLRDRFDLCLTTRPVEIERLVGPPSPAPFTAEQVHIATQRQQARARALHLVGGANAHIPSTALPGAVAPTRDALAHLALASTRMSLSARAAHRALRVARTLADLCDSDRTTPTHLAEALAWRT